jgi:cephalosporin hydroxylase
MKSGKPGIRPWNRHRLTRRLRATLHQIYGQIVSDAFHHFYYAAPDTWKRNHYFGQRVLQFPGDLWLYQELIVAVRPTYIVQTGVAFGGSLLYFAHLLDLIQAAPEAVVVGVDHSLSSEAKALQHPRIRLVEGDSVDATTLRQVATLLPAGPGMVSLDSDHTASHVLHELQCYHDLVGVGCHLVVEDTNLNGHPVWHGFGPGPYEAVAEFLATHPGFVRDESIWRRNLFSFHRHGWLLRIN